MNKLSVIVAVALLSVGCAKKQRALTMQETVVETPPAAQQAKKAAENKPERGAPREAQAPIYFGYNSSELESDSRVALTRLANSLKSDPNLKLLIAGNCDERGSTEFNLALGERRANSAREYLVRMGVSENQIDLVSYGEERPAAAGEGESAWALNRRDEFYLSSN